MGSSHKAKSGHSKPANKAKKSAKSPRRRTKKAPDNVPMETVAEFLARGGEVQRFPPGYSQGFKWSWMGNRPSPAAQSAAKKTRPS